MKNSDELFGMLARQAAKEVVNTDEKDRNSSNRLLLALLGILAFVGVEAIKVTFRRNFGREGLSLFRVVICFLIFIGIGIFAYFKSQKDPQEIYIWGSQKSFIATSIFYILFGIYILFKGIQEKGKSVIRQDIHPYYKGDSYLLAAFVNEETSQSRIQNLEEPFLTLSIGVFLAGFNFLLGLPIVFCAISVWGYQLIESLFGDNQVEEQLQQRGYSMQQSSEFTEIKD